MTEDHVVKACESMELIGGGFKGIACILGDIGGNGPIKVFWCIKPCPDGRSS